MSAAPLLEVRGLEVDRGGARVLDVPSFRLEERELVALIGPNGSGKSTLLLALMTLLPRTAGQLLWRGAPIATSADALASRRRMAMVLQEPLLFRGTVYDNVASGLRIRGVPRREERRRVLAYLERFGIASLAERAALKLSGGEARRVSVARALAVEPEVVFLDEPFANIDPPSRAAITVDVERTLRDLGAAAILVTHDQADALRLSDRVAVMSAGRVVQSDLPSVVMNAPVNAFVASCMGMETIVEGTVVRSGSGVLAIAVPGAEILAGGEASPGDSVYCCVRPEHVTIETAAPAGTSARNVLPGRVAGVASEGVYLKVKLDCGFPLVATVTSESYTRLGLAPGRDVHASFKATAVHVIRREHPRRDGGG